MNGLRRLVGGLVLLLALVGFVGCLAGIVGIWMLRTYTGAKVETVAARLDLGLERTTTATNEIRRALQTARTEVAKVNKESAALSGDTDKKPVVSGAMRKLIQRQLEPKINDLGGRLATFADAAVVVASLLQSAQDLPAGQIGDLEPEKMKEAADQAGQLSVTLRKLQRVFDDDDRPAGVKEISEATNEVEAVLEKCQTIVDEWHTGLSSTRAKLTSIKTKLLGWLTPLAIIVTVVLAWVALSQISLLAHAWKWMRGE